MLPDHDPLRAIRALVDVRDRLGGLMTIQIAVLALPITPVADLEAALDAGADLVGGAPHIADDPLAELTKLSTSPRSAASEPICTSMNSSTATT